MKKHILLGLTAVCALLSVAACPGDQTPPIDRAAVLRSIGERVALATYQEFATRSVPLREAAGHLCAAPSLEALDVARTRWKEARRPWKRAEVFAFGPHTDEPWRVGPKVDFWPVRVSSVEELLAGTGAVDASAVAVLGAHLKGLPVMEYLLFSAELDDASVLARFAEGASGARRCAYLGGVATDVEVQAHRMVEAWSPGAGDYVGRLVRSGGEDGALPTLALAYSEVVNRMIFAVENVREIKIGKPRGAATGNGPDVSLVESRFSGNSVQDILDLYDGVEAVYRGSLVAEDAGAVGLRTSVLERRPELDPQFFEALSAARAAAASIPVPLTEALLSHPDEVQATYQTALTLQRLLAIDIAQALSVTVAFNDTDGD